MKTYGRHLWLLHMHWQAVISSFTYPIALEAATRIFGNYVITENAMLNTIFAGLGIGIGLGIVIRTGASTGGMDIPPLVLHKYFRIPVSVSLNAFDMLILVMQVIYNPPERVLYGILLVLVYTTVLTIINASGSICLISFSTCGSSRFDTILSTI